MPIFDLNNICSLLYDQKNVSALLGYHLMSEKPNELRSSAVDFAAERLDSDNYWVPVRVGSALRTGCS